MPKLHGLIFIRFTSLTVNEASCPRRGHSSDVTAEVEKYATVPSNLIGILLAGLLCCRFLYEAHDATVSCLPESAQCTGLCIASNLTCRPQNRCVLVGCSTVHR